MSELVIPARNALFEEAIHNPYGEDSKYHNESGGWFFSAGNPEYWKYQDRLLVPGGSVLDAGIGFGRSSLFFALHGMRVTGYDTNTDGLTEVEGMANDLGLNYELVAGDFIQSDVAPDSFDTVILDHTLAHQESKEDCLQLIEKGYGAVKPGGHIWIRVNGIEDSRYWDLEHEAHVGYRRYGMRVMESQVQIIEPGIIEHPCSCSGELRLDRSVFFEQIEILQWLCSQGAEIVHSQCLPVNDGHNIMFGEDFNRMMPAPYLGGTITAIAKKPPQG